MFGSTKLWGGFADPLPNATAIHHTATTLAQYFMPVRIDNLSELSMCISCLDAPTAIRIAANVLILNMRRLAFQQLRRGVASSRPRYPSWLRSPQPSCPTCPPQRAYATVSAAELQFGQPIHETHPHLLRAGERRFWWQNLICFTNCVFSHPRYNSSRICRSKSEACCEPPCKRDCNTSIFRYEISLRSSLLRVSPRAEFFIPNRLQRT